MNEEAFKIYVDQLRDGHEEHLHESFSPEFLDIVDPDLSFEKPIELDGLAYIAENELVLDWTIETEALVSCSICNEKVPVKIYLENVYECQPLSQIKSGIFNFKELLRELILLEVPGFVECHEGQCPKRKELDKYFKSSFKEDSDQEGYRPFADLDWN